MSNEQLITGINISTVDGRGRGDRETDRKRWESLTREDQARQEGQHLADLHLIMMLIVEGSRTKTKGRK